MKHVLWIVVCGLLAGGCGTTASTVAPHPEMSALEVAARTEALMEVIVPPRGTAMADVEAVYGKPVDVAKLTRKDLGGIYSRHRYELQPANRRRTAGTDLVVTCREKLVHMVRLEHTAGVAGKKRVVLQELQHIRTKYRTKLRESSWNQ